MKKAILLSGGIDSAVLAYWKKPDLAININYGQLPAIAEQKAARAIARALGIKLICLNIDCSVLGSGDLINRTQLRQGSSREWWPYRNQLLITMAAAEAIRHEVKELMIGAVITDQKHADGKRKFYQLIDQLIKFQEGRMRISVPAIEYHTEELIQLKKVPVSLLGWTHSCHKSNLPCGKCNGCNKHLYIKEQIGLI